MPTSEENRALARRILAQRIAKRKAGETRNPVADLGSGINETLVQVAAYPFDLATNVMSMFLPELRRRINEGSVGSAEPIIRKGAQAAGLINADELPDSRAQRVGRIMASAAPGVGIVGFLAKAQKITAPIVAGFRSAPKAFAASETVAAAGAAAGGEIGREHDAEIIGQLIGGISAPLAVSTAVRISPSMNALKVMKPLAQSFTKKGSQKVASDVVRSAVPDSGLVRNLANDANLLPGEKLTLGGKAGSARLLSLEKAVANKLPEVADDMARNEAETNRIVHEALAKSGGGTIDDTVAFFEGQRIRLENALNARVAAAVTQMDDSISKLRPDADRAQTSRIISDELEDALKDARIQENQIWDNLDGTQEVGLSATQQAMKDFVTEETPLPAFVKDSLKGSSVKSFKDVRELRSKILRVQRGFRAQGNAEAAWVLQQINKGILRDIEDSNLGPDFGNAVSFSRTLNDKFTRGPVGNLMRFSSRGGRAVSPELISENILGASAPKSAANVRAVRTAVGSSEALESALVDNIKNKLFKNTGEFNEASAKKFVESHGELLDEFPALKQQISNAHNDINAQKALAGKIANAKTSILDRRRSAAALILGANPDKRFEALLNSPKRKMMLSQAVRVTRKDADAFAGLQDAYTRALVDKGTTSGLDASGNKFLSGKNMRMFFNSTKDDILNSGLYTKDDIARMNTIITTAERLEKQVHARAGEAELIMKKANLMEDFIMSYAGAQLGAQFSNNLGSSLVLAQKGSGLVHTIAQKLPFDKINKILGEAVKNPELMKDLLDRPTNFKAEQHAMKRLNAWMATLGINEEEAQ